MTKSHLVISLSLFGLIGATTAMASTTFASTGQTNNTPQYTIMNSGGLVTVTASGQDFFTFLVGGTPFSGPVLANFSLTATSTQPGACGTAGCPSGNSFVEQGYSGSFSYIASGGAHNGMNLLSGTFNVNATPGDSGGKFSSTNGGNGGTYTATATAGNLNGIQMSSDFLNFAGVTNETGAWALSGLTPIFVANPTATQLTLPLDGTSFVASNVGTFSSQQAPSSVPEPATLGLLGSALVGLGLLRRNR